MVGGRPIAWVFLVSVLCVPASVSRYDGGGGRPIAWVFLVSVLFVPANVSRYSE